MPNRLSFTKLQADTITTRLGIVQERVIPSKRGSILVGTTETQKIVLKIADINNRATEEGITPSRSWGIRNEARIISKLPNHIAPKLLHHAIDPNGLIYSVISYIDPCEDRPTANINLLKDYFSRLIAAVTDMHKSGIIHGDIQPDNVIFPRLQTILRRHLWWILSFPDRSIQLTKLTLDLIIICLLKTQHGCSTKRK